MEMVCYRLSTHRDLWLPAVQRLLKNRGSCFPFTSALLLQATNSCSENFKYNLTGWGMGSSALRGGCQMTVQKEGQVGNLKERIELGLRKQSVSKLSLEVLWETCHEGN